MESLRQIDHLVLELQQLLVFVHKKQQFLCEQLPNIMFLHNIYTWLQGTVKQQCQYFAFSYHRQGKISYKSVFHIPVCPRPVTKYGWHAILIFVKPDILLDLTFTLPRGLLYTRTHTHTVTLYIEPRSCTC